MKRDLFCYLLLITSLQLRLRLVHIKVFSERKMFSCVWLHFKKYFEKYFLMFGYVLENIIENTFSTCCSHFLTFSWLPNEYIISFIPQNINKTQKKIIKSEHFARSRSTLRAIAIGAVPVMSADDLSNRSFGRSRRARLWTISASSALDDLYSLFFLSPSLSFSRSLLTFSHIFSVAKRIYNIIHSSKHKQNPEKNHQIWTFHAIAIDASHDRDWCGAGDVGGRFQWTISAIEALDDLGELGFG